MSNNQKKKKKFHLPKRSGLLYLLMFLVPVLLFFIIAIPVVYVNNYNKHKLQLFPDQLKDIEASSIVYADGKVDAIPDFNFVLYCDTYNNSSSSNQIKFCWFSYYNDKTESVFNIPSGSSKKPSISVRLQMNANWIDIQNNGVSTSAYSKSIAPNAKTANPGTSSSNSYFYTVNISNIPQLPIKGDLPFIKVKTIPVYAYITYTVTENAQSKTKHYVLKYEYKDYIVNKLVFDEGTSNETSFGPTNGGI